MLVLSRKKNESIVINNNIRVTILDIRGDRIRIGFEAESDIPIYREEVQEKINQEKSES